MSICNLWTALGFWWLGVFGVKIWFYKWYLRIDLWKNTGLMCLTNMSIPFYLFLYNFEEMVQWNNHIIQYQHILKKKSLLSILWHFLICKSYALHTVLLSLQQEKFFVKLIFNYIYLEAIIKAHWSFQPYFFMLPKSLCSAQPWQKANDPLVCSPRQCRFARLKYSFCPSEKLWRQKLLPQLS